MGKTAFIFPGQGSQTVGMGLEIAQALPEAARILDGACDILGRDIRKLMWEGPEEILQDTGNAQPAIFICSAMVLEKARAQGLNCDLVAGHSLGEYSALYAAGVFSFEKGLQLVAKRGEFMGRMNGKGSMAAVLGMKEQELCEVLDGLDFGKRLVIANLNTPTQLIVSGENECIERLTNALEGRDGISVKPLKVSAAFHSPQMEEAAMEMKPLLEETKFSIPDAVVYSNVTGLPTKDPDEIRRNLIAQITGQVRWYDSILAMQADGAGVCYEIGHGKLLRRMQRLITSELRCLPVE